MKCVIVMYLRSQMTPHLLFSLPMPFWFYLDKLTDSRLESILKRADGKLARLSIQLYGYDNNGEPVPYWASYTCDIQRSGLSWTAPLSPSIMSVILNASREKRLDHLDLNSCLEVGGVCCGLKKFHFTSLCFSLKVVTISFPIIHCLPDASITTCMMRDAKPVIY